MNTITIRPSSACSYSWNTVSICGNTTSTAAPTSEPKIEPMPPSTTMATSSIERRNPAASGVTRPLNSARNDPATEA